MVFTKTFNLETEKGSVCDISADVWEAVKQSGIMNGIAVVETAHSTAGIVRTTSYAGAVLDDVVKEMRRLVPARINFKHEESPDDAAGHIKCALFGTSVSAIVRDGALVSENKLGIFFVEYDGPRSRCYDVCVVGE